VRLIVMDADEQVRQAVADGLAEFARTGSADGVVQAIHGQPRFQPCAGRNSSRLTSRFAR